MRAAAFALLAVFACLLTPTSLAIKDEGVAVFEQCGHAVPVGAGTNGYDSGQYGTYTPCGSPCAVGVHVGRVWVAWEPQCTTTQDVGSAIK